MKLTAVRKNRQGKITHFLTDAGNVVTVEEAREMAHNGLIDSLTDLQADGSWFIDNEIGYAEGENLDQLPEF